MPGQGTRDRLPSLAQKRALEGVHDPHVPVAVSRRRLAAEVEVGRVARPDLAVVGQVAPRHGLRPDVVLEEHLRDHLVACPSPGEAVTARDHELHQVAAEEVPGPAREGQALVVRVRCRRTSARGGRAPP